MTKAATKYIHLLKRKRIWTPVSVSAGQLMRTKECRRAIKRDPRLEAQGKEVVYRALALRSLEIPVGDFIADAMKGDLPQGIEAEGCRELLLSNVKDEEKHDIALNFAAEAHQVPAQFEREAARITKAWLELDRHPVLKAVVLERSVFFVLLPIFRFLGDTGLRTTSADISRDETTHVAANTIVCQELGLKTDKELNKLRRATVAWVLQSLQGETEVQADHKHFSSNFWLGCSDSLYTSGKALGLSDTRASRFPAFFESSNVNLPMYS